MNNAYYIVFQRNILSGVLLAALSLFALPAFSQEVLRVVTLTAAGPEQQKELENVAPGKLYVSAKGCRWVKFWSDHSTGENGSVSLWKSRADLDAFLNSDAYKAIFPGKVKSLSKGDVSVKIYPVFKPKH